MRWTHRPVEVANLLNPAFCAVLLHDSIEAYSEKDERGLNYLLVYLILPLVLHSKTRDLIPIRQKTTFIEWVELHQINNWITVENIRQLIPITKEALIFGIQHYTIDFSNQEDYYDHLISLKPLRKDKSWLKGSKPIECRNKAKIVGAWFGEITDPATIYRTLGIRP